MTNSISLALSVIARKGDTIAVESPVYFGILQLANSMGLRVLELPTNPVTGIEPDALRKVLPQINLCLLISNFSNPLGSCMPDEHKKEVVQMLAEYNIPLIEDDLYGDVFFGHSRPKPCKAFDEKGLVLWCGSVSKTLAPGYRVGWIAPGKFKDAVIRQKHIHLISLLPSIRRPLPTLWKTAGMRIIYAGCAMNYIPTVFIWHNLLPTISPKTLKS